MELPKNFSARMKQMLGDEYDEFIGALQNAPIRTGLRVNERKECAYSEISDIIGGLEKIEWCNNGFYCDKKTISGTNPYHVAGLFYFQEPSAMASVEALTPKKDDYILDLCAAPGGKATQAGAYLDGSGLLVANEIIPKRAAILAENIERMGIANSIVTNESPEKLAEKFPQFFDKIIVDAPCSGEGMFRKEPQAVTEWSINHTKTCAVRQRHILDFAYKMLAPGGYIAYSTCTFAPCENEETVEYFLDSHSDMSLADTGLDMLSAGRNEWASGRYDMTKTRRIFPHTQKGEGHFIALLKKDGERADRAFSKKTTKKNTESGVKLFKAFEKETLFTDFDGCFEMFGDNLYLVPHGIDTDGLKLVRGGLHLGVCKKNRFEPSQALLSSLELSEFKNSVSFFAESEEIRKYLRGETINSDVKGYCCMAVGKAPLGWAKGSDGILKNHFPKYLRLP